MKRCSHEGCTYYTQKAGVCKGHLFKKSLIDAPAEAEVLPQFAEGFEAMTEDVMARRGGVPDVQYPSHKEEKSAPGYGGLVTW